ncbi:50S ribosomal protein L24 [Candidatus Woesearchaeota archaeon]|nr:50S ribosomal protein L24 [Candidatus Woesearchaeota archaeon]
MKLFSLSWNSSSKASKQRKYRANAPLHLKRKFLSAALSPEMKGKYGAKSLSLREGDSVKITRGEFRGISGKVNDVNLSQGIVYVDGAERLRKDGTKSFLPIAPSSLLIVEASFDDKRRAMQLSRKQGKQVKAEKPKAAPKGKK